MKSVCFGLKARCRRGFLGTFFREIFQNTGRRWVNLMFSIVIRVYTPIFSLDTLILFYQTQMQVPTLHVDLGRRCFLVRYMGYLFTVSSFARIVAPIYGAEFLREYLQSSFFIKFFVFLYVSSGPHFVWLLSAFFFLITIFFLLACSQLLSGKLSYFEIRAKKESELSKETLSVYEAFWFFLNNFPSF